MTPEVRKPLIHLEILAIISLCGVLFIAAIPGHPLWSIPAMPLFAFTGLTLLCALLRGFKDVTQPAT
jgi:hypothetical protein